MTIAESVKILRTVQQVRQWRLQRLLNGKTVGFIPTMGALHDGHCSLVSQSLKDNDETVVSIFVNPSQFAPHEDLDSYPRTIDSDLSILASKFRSSVKQVDAIFIPKISEMYPSGINLEISKQRGAFVFVKGSSEQLEGVTRPQFFRGVATIVTKLLNVVQPTNIYFGQKDAQQCIVIKNLVKDLLIDTNVRVMPTLRESNGLAMSSRNQYLSPQIKQESSIIYNALKSGESLYYSKNAKVESSEILTQIKTVLNLNPNFKIEYVSINHPETLDEIDYIEPGVGALISLAVLAPKENSDGHARLIDNIILH
ncbi:pantoate--beta-alanine ligase [Scheffersomyces coipomensis]|uniref:pantoate--beta-alanine ligase n=1 Tax=Scheffersomyces coipomensis TaxID=1788519 RepID=UPI00315D4708